MAVQATDQHIEVFVDAVILLQTSVDIKDIVKTDENGENGEPGTIVDLFPVGAAAHGRGQLEFRIKAITRDQMPNLANRSQATVPMAYIREVNWHTLKKISISLILSHYFQETFNELVKSTMKLAAVGIKTAGLMAWMGVLMAIGCIIAGAGLIYLDKAKTPVEALDDD